MIIRLIDAGWSREITDAIALGEAELQIISPFIKDGALAKMLVNTPTVISAITRYNLRDFANGVSDISALRRVLDMGGQVRGIKNLHAKMYLFGERRVIVSSANLTHSGFNRNHEFGFVSEGAGIIAECKAYFERLWELGGRDLEASLLDTWNEKVTRHQMHGGPKSDQDELGDYGAEVFGEDDSPSIPIAFSDASQGFVKFLGSNDNRVPYSFETVEEVRLSGCHWALSYPIHRLGRRPTAVKDGAVMYMGRMSKDPNDIVIFGRALGWSHMKGRDDATDDDKKLRPFKTKYSHYVRVHDAEFLSGCMSNGVSLNYLMDELGSDAFLSTQRNALRGQGNVDPRRAYSQQAQVQLSGKGLAWLNAKLQAAFDKHGQIPQATIDELDWPEIPEAK